MAEQVNRVSDEELAHWLAFDQLTGNAFSPKKAIQLFETFESMQEIWKASRNDLKAYEGWTREQLDGFIARRDEVDPFSLLEKLRKTDVDAICYCDPYYPIRLRNIFDPPMVLYKRGSLPLESFSHCLGIIGTRRPTGYGQRVAKELARELAAKGVLIVSGMALGIDSIAHWGTLEGGGKTVAVLACGPDICYPSSNKHLYSAIVDKGGAIVSEYFPGTTPEKFRFPQRNRIISGLSDGLVVVEAGEESGALITARMAFEQSRTVFAIPGRVDSPMSAGTNKIIRQQIAILVSGAEDIMKGMEWVSIDSGNRVQTVVELYGREREVFEMLSNEPIHFDVLMDKTNMQAGELSATLTMLELAGLAVRHTGEWYSRQVGATTIKA